MVTCWMEVLVCPGVVDAQVSALSWQEHSRQTHVCTTQTNTELQEALNLYFEFLPFTFTLFKHVIPGS